MDIMRHNLAIITGFVGANYAFALALTALRSKSSSSLLSKRWYSRACSVLFSSKHKVSNETLNDSQVSVRAYWQRRDGEHSYLESVDGDDALNWVREQNAKTTKFYGKPEEQKIYNEILNILESKDKIPTVFKIGNQLYNYWDDSTYPRGVLRRTTLVEFEKPLPKWENVLDFDALGKKEKESWVYKGCDVYRPDDKTIEPTRVLLSLSRGGADATETREFDLVTLDFVSPTSPSNGFFLPEAKSRISWLDADTLLIGTDMKDGKSMTDSGYPRTCREWKRGTALADSRLIAECAKTDMYIMSYTSKHRGYKCVIKHTALTFYTSHDSIRVPGSSEFVPVPKQDDANISLFADKFLISLRSDWKCKQATFPAGSLVSVSVAEFLAKAADSTFTVIFTPTNTRSLSSWTSTLNYLALTLLDDVKTRVVLWKLKKDGEWTLVGTEDEALVRGISLSAFDREESDAVWLQTSSFIQPTKLSLVQVDAGVSVLKDPKVLKALPDQFNSDGLIEYQRFATSKDGTKVPYTIIGNVKALKTGNVPTVLYGYGGFEISMLPNYAKVTGKAWLEKGFCWVVSNIRGGGEYGPEWHKVALKRNRELAYDDFIAIAEDLIAQNVTSSSKLAIYGGSNGGLLMGNIMNRRPELFRACICSVPLLDMRRYSHLLAGASWMAEYGDPDVEEEWEFLQCYSAYHNINPHSVARYPELLMFTSTRDDRVHPYHARSYVKRLLEVEGKAGERIHYFENIEGGHGGAADLKQMAAQQTLYFTFLTATLASAK